MQPILLKYLSQASIILLLAACSVSGPKAPDTDAGYNAANTIIIPPIPYSVTEVGVVLSAKDDPCDIPTNIRNAIAWSLEAPLLYLLPDNKKNIADVRILKLEVVDILVNGGGVFSGPKMAEVKGTLFKNDKPVASFKARRQSMPVAMPLRTTCNIMGRATEGLGWDIADWLKQPQDGALLGDY